MDVLITGVYCSDAKHLASASGDIFHIMRNDVESYNGFGEVYISTVKHKTIKGWKKHTRMRLNIVVPSGSIRFILYNPETKEKADILLSPENYKRLTVEPGIWMAFKGETAGTSFLVNFADIPHDPFETESLALDQPPVEHDWK